MEGGITIIFSIAILGECIFLNKCGMVPAGNALGVLIKKAHIPPLKISGIKNRYNAADETFYDAIKALP